MLAAALFSQRARIFFKQNLCHPAFIRSFRNIAERIYSIQQFLFPPFSVSSEISAWSRDDCVCLCVCGHVWEKMSLYFSLSGFSTNVVSHEGTSRGGEDPKGLMNGGIPGLSSHKRYCFHFDWDKSGYMYQLSRASRIFTGEMKGRTSQPLLKNFGIREEREVIVLQKNFLMVHVLRL